MIRNFMLTLFLAALCCAPAHAVTFDWATVGNPGNADDIHDDGSGGVDYTYRISKHEVTNAQYTEFLNAVAATDSFGGSDPTLYNTRMASSTWGGIVRSGSAGSYTYSVKPDPFGQGSGNANGDDYYYYAKKPVAYVSFFDAMRFTNWLHNGQGSGGTETGVYNISDGLSEVRAADAKYWIPSEDEWYKAAYYDPNAGGGSGAYYYYPTGTNVRPNNNRPANDRGNSANFFDFDGTYTTGDTSYPMTDVGAYSLSESPYGTFDQGGNVGEWNEAVFGSSSRGLRGGSWFLSSTGMLAFVGGSGRPTAETSRHGFRVATVPEPSTMLMGALAAVGLLVWRRRLGSPLVL